MASWGEVRAQNKTPILSEGEQQLAAVWLRLMVIISR